MALAYYALCTVPELKDELDSPQDTGRLDARLEAIINRCSAVIREEMNGRDIITKGSTYVEYHSMRDGLRELYTLQYPITSVVELREDPTHAFGAGTVVDPSWYTVIGGSATHRGKLMRTLEDRWLEGWRYYQLTYNAGFADNANKTNVPGPLRDACLSFAALRWREIERKAQGEMVKTDLSGATTRFMDRSLTSAHLTDEMRALIQPFRREGYMETAEAA